MFILVEALKSTCNEIDPVVGENGAKNFAKVVSVLSQSKKSDILQVYSDVKNGAGFKNKELAMWVTLLLSFFILFNKKNYINSEIFKVC